MLPMHDENTNEKKIFSSIASFFSPKPLPNKKNEDLKKGQNYWMMSLM